ncbi:hypothetical protein [Parasedimentitalea psychrophila]|uniref:Uncharacterized protein n=1 Tax=Parasedimentitalea psychrophila TaxID=2997337 RepID=A0A9Y2L325_9RHOB|nr:hypothetical protein [Parasedimentitalea psychrophila]WIY27418.1 hypothetical protein QPJ95_11180 [Parasedimentitalea psychrophila]
MVLAQLDFVRRAETVHFLDPPGTGKSHSLPGRACWQVREEGDSAWRGLRQSGQERLPRDLSWADRSVAQG